MKKCCIYLDFIENADSSDPAQRQDVLAHAGKCPDCSSDMKFRAEMLEHMADAPEPEYPPVLHSIIIESVYANARTSETAGLSSRIAEFFDGMLRPAEIAALGCSLAAVFFLMQVDSGAEQTEARIGRYARARKVTAATVRQPQKLNIPGSPDRSGIQLAANSLEPVSQAEIDMFLHRLKDYNRRRPEEVQAQKGFSPELRLVNTITPDY